MPFTMDCPLDAPLRQALPDLAAWTAHFLAAEIPVLASTAEAIEALRANEDDVDANLIGEMVAGDPLMTLRVLSHAAANRSPRMVTDTGTVTAAVVMMGISPFFRDFGPLPTVEDRLREHPAALAGIQAVLRRSHRAATFAIGFAVHRMDPDAALIHQAALLHDFAELLLWCHAPALAVELQRLQHSDPVLRSSAAQRMVLNVDLGDLQQALMRTWRLHELLVKTADERHEDRPSVRTVALAVRLARHSTQGWENAALADDFSDAAGLLNLSLGAARQLIHAIGA
jgi:HD-like signal output (HDOD) protein